jgi:hypothetical protein
MLASFPAAGDPIEDAVPRPVLALTGTTDVFDFDRLEDELDRFAGDTLDARIDGMNHYAWTDDATDAELDSDGEQRRAIPATRTDAQRVLDAWLDVSLFDADESALDGPFPGVEVQ